MKVFMAFLATVAGGWLLLNLVGALLVGAIARAVLPGKDKVGWPLTIVLGFLGGILGKLVAFMIGWPHLGIVKGFLVSVVGAVVLLIAHRIWSASKSHAGAQKA